MFGKCCFQEFGSLSSINSWTVYNDQEWRKWQSSLAKMHRFFVFVRIEKYRSLSVVDWQFLAMPSYSRSCFQRLHDGSNIDCMVYHFFLLLPLSNCYVRYLIFSVNFKARNVYIDEVYSSSCHNVHIILDAHKQEQILWSQNRSLLSWLTLLLFKNHCLTIFDTTFSFVNSSSSSSVFVRIDDNI